jgi:hypothetical protein
MYMLLGVLYYVYVVCPNTRNYFCYIYYMLVGYMLLGVILCIVVCVPTHTTIHNIHYAPFVFPAFYRSSVGFLRFLFLRINILYNIIIILFSQPYTGTIFL